MQNKLVKKQFTLIELLVVIGILGLLATLVISNYSKIEDDASKAISNFNSKSVSNIVSNFYAANHAYPAGFSTGATTTSCTVGCSDAGVPNAAAGDAAPISTLPACLTANINNGSAMWTGVVADCLRNVGIAYLSAGEEGQESKIYTYKGKAANGDDTGVDWTAAGTAGDATLPVALKICASAKDSKEFTLDGKADGTPLKLNGMTLGEYCDQAPWTKEDTNQEQSIVYAFFFGPATNTQVVYDVNGQVLKDSRANATFKRPESSKCYSYPLCFFRLSKEKGPVYKASYLGCVTFNDEGTLMQQ